MKATLELRIPNTDVVMREFVIENFDNKEDLNKFVKEKNDELKYLHLIVVNVEREEKKVAEKIVEEILDEGLADSTWRDMFPEAYVDLRDSYREDLEGSVEMILKNLRNK